jgi:DME family drug/metabolite transporter
MAEGALTTGVVLSAVGAVMLASQAVFIRIGTDRGTVAHALATVLAINVVILGGGTLVAFYPDYGLTPFSFAVFAGAGLSGTVLARSLYFLSIDRIGASRTEPIKSSQPLHATLVAVLVLGEIVTSLHLFGILLIVVGVAAISWETNRHGGATREVALYELGFPLGAAFFFGVEPTFVKLGFAEGTPVFVGLAIKTAAAAVGFSVYLWWQDAMPSLQDLRTPATRWYLLAGLANTAFMIAYFFALEVAPVALVVPIVQSSPLIVLVFSVLFLDRLERVTPRLAGWAIVAVAGAILVTLAS